jgi:hypothetical protein
MKKGYDLLRTAKAGVKLSNDDVAFLSFKESMQGVDLGRVDIDSTLGRIEEKLDRLSSTRVKVQLALGAVLILIFASLNGVTFEISIIGVKLSGIERIKEVLVLLVAGGGVLAQVLDSQIDDLRALRRVLLVEKIGEPAFVALRGALKHEANFFGHSFVAFNTMFDVTGWRKRAESFNLYLVGISMILVCIVSAWITLEILMNIWIDPNVNWIVARIIAIASGIIFSGQFLVTIARSIGNATYIDEKKWKEFPFYKPGTEEVSDEVVAFIVEQKSKKK